MSCRQLALERWDLGRIRLEQDALPAQRAAQEVGLPPGQRVARADLDERAGAALDILKPPLERQPLALVEGEPGPRGVAPWSERPVDVVARHRHHRQQPAACCTRHEEKAEAHRRAIPVPQRRFETVEAEASMKPPRRGWGGGAGEAVAFVTSQYLRQAVSHDQSAASRRSECNAFNCALFQWAVQVQAVATRVQRPQSPASVHIFSACFSSTLAETMSRCHERTRCPARVRVYSHHARELVQAVDAMQAHAQAHKPCCPEWEAQAVRMLLRWEVFAMTMAQVVVYLDLDTEILPLWSQMLVQRKEQYWPRDCNSTWGERLDEAAVQLVAQDWRHLISCAASETTNPYLMLSFPDHSSPVNGAVLIVRPNTSIYLEGIDVLRRATRFTPFNTSLGWEHVGRPSEVIPPTDHVWWRRRRHTHIVDENNWDFVGGRTDQGFFFYMLRVRHRLGGDLRMSSCARIPHMNVRPSYYFHYGSAGGRKPENMLQQWNSMQQKSRCYGRVVPHFGENGEVIERTISWARRTRAEVSDAMRCLEREEAAASLVAKVGAAQQPSVLEEIQPLPLECSLGTCSKCVFNSPAVNCEG